MAAVFFAAFFLAAIIHYLLRYFYDPMSPIAVTHRGSPWSLNDEVSMTLAVLRNGSRTVVSVVTTKCRNAIQVVLIPECHVYVKGLIRFFFVKCPVKCFECGDVHHAHGPFEGSSTHRMRALRNCLVRPVHKSRRGKDFARVVGPTAHCVAQLIDNR